MNQETDDKPSKAIAGSGVAQAALAFGFAAIAIFSTLGDNAESDTVGSAPHTKELSSLDVATGDPAHAEADLYCIDEPQFADPLPVTTHEDAEPQFPNAEQLRMIGRLTKGMIKLKGKRDLGQWWECGELYETDSAQWDAAMEWAYRIVYLSWEYSDNGSDDGRIINPWGVAGVAYNESGFDRCALGTWPRKWAYSNGMLKPRKRCISHRKDEIIKAMSSDDAISAWRRTGIDAAPLHELWRCSKDGCKPKYSPSLPPIGFEEIFSLGKGFEYNVRQMKRRADRHGTDRPWLYWRGYECEWYDEKITRWARAMGATKEEI